MITLKENELYQEIELFVDGEKIKADTYYKLAGGVFKEIQ